MKNRYFLSAVMLMLVSVFAQEWQLNGMTPRITNSNASIAENCPICLDEFNNSSGNSVEKISLSCNHIYHKGCIGEWVIKNNTCPLCRQNLNFQDKKKCTSCTQIVINYSKEILKVIAEIIVASDNQITA